mmetsp:Transcript_87659/g.151873  ORF Transcript_87659/g.151873 Transcript_87659/m.151873 type:complete len:175 (+) Transcript_87659:66-590(+)
MSRSVSTLALHPEHYGKPKGMTWQGVKETDRFPPMYPDHSQVFEEYMSHPTMAPSRHEGTLAKSAGLLELHYNTMRKKQWERSKSSCHVQPPTMSRPFTATVGYGGFIPGKASNNVCGCTFAQGSRLARELRPLAGVGSGMVFTFGKSSSMPSLTGDAYNSSRPAMQLDSTQYR